MEKLKEEIEKHLLEISAKKLPSTVRLYRRGLMTFLRFCEKNRIESISQINVSACIQFVGYMRYSGYSQNTIQIYSVALGGFIKHIIINGFYSPDYMEIMRLGEFTKSLHAKRQRLPKTPTEEDVNKILEAVNNLPGKSPIRERNKAMILLLYSSGLRNAELTSLKVEDVDLQSLRGKIIGKGGKEAVFFFSQDAADAISEYLSVRGNSSPPSPLFSRHDKRISKKILPMTTQSVRNIVRYVCVVSGTSKRFSPHSFRHGFAVRILRETGNLALTQDLMRHSSPDTTRIYAKVIPEELAQVHKSIFDKKKAHK